MLDLLDRYFNSAGILLIAFILYIAVVALRDEPHIVSSIGLTNGVLQVTHE